MIDLSTKFEKYFLMNDILLYVTMQNSVIFIRHLNMLEIETTHSNIFLSLLNQYLTNCTRS